VYSGRIVVAPEPGRFEEVTETIRNAGFTVEQNVPYLLVLTEEENLEEIRSIDGVRNADPDYYQEGFGA
jgi:hypothetical protein